MATAKQSSTKLKRDAEREKKEKERNAQDILPASERLKTIIRRLPPNLPEDVFWGSVQSWVSDETVTWKAYYPGKVSTRVNKENIPSRAYIAFKNEDLISAFSREYDGHVFRDKAGNEFQAVVEFAPYQKIPSDRKKPDARNATIEKDEDYISYIEALNASKEKGDTVTLETLIASTQPVPTPTTTPLLEALKAEKSAAKDREAILRNHAHYKEIASRKDDAKKKAASQTVRAENAAHPVTEASGSGKRSKRGGPPPKQTPSNAQAPAGGPKPPSAQTKPSLSGGSTDASPAKPSKPSKHRAKQAPVDSTATTPVSPSTATERPPVQPPAPAGSSQPQPQNATAQPPTAPRRMRLGLASRQFEAALNGAGVSRRRDREESPATEGNRDGATESAPARPTQDDSQPPQTPSTPVHPRSPRRDRRRKEGGGSDSVPKPANAASDPGEIRVPGILQRIDAPQAENDAALSNMTARIDVAPHPPNFGPPVRGGPRGRGRGRGRGGPPRGS